MIEPLLHFDAVVQRNPEALAAEVQGEVVLMNLDRGEYYGLDAIGSEIWRQLEQPISIAELCNSLAGEYNAAPEVIAQDVLALLEAMRGCALIELRDRTRMETDVR